MYVARRLSEYKKNPYAVSFPPDGPNSGFLVVQDAESETYSCLGLCKNRTLKDLPFPQNKALTVHCERSSGEHSHVSLKVMLIPVLNLPLSSNRYYAINAHGRKHKGKAFTCSREEDMTSCCFCRSVKDIKPKPFDSRNIYQQFEICAYEASCISKGYFYAKSVAADGYPPYFMREKGWSLHTKTPKNYTLDEASGLNAGLRALRPEVPSDRAVVVGKWYTPFMFVKEGGLKDQVKRSAFYEVILEQKWEKIFSRTNYQNNHHGGGNKSVSFAVNLDLKMVNVEGNRAVWDEGNVVEGAIWFRSFGRNGKEATVGLSVELVQRMKWEEERGGWIGGRERQVNVERAEKFEGKGDWREFGCYVLVESYVIKRMDASVVMTWDFRHTHHIKSIWE